MKNYSGLLIVFEGIDNAGKTTQISSVAEHLLSQGKKVIISREMSTSIGHCFRVDFEQGKLSPRVKALLFAAERYCRLEWDIIPALKQGVIVLADRWVLSSLVYRGIEGEGLDLAEHINRDVILPDATYLIDVEPKMAYQRGLVANRKSPYSEGFLNLARQRYLEMAEMNELIMIDGMQSIEQVTRSIVQHLRKLLEESNETDSSTPTRAS